MAFSCIEFPLDSGASQTWEENGVIGKRSVLTGGVRVLSEKIPGHSSVSLSFWIGAGSRDEKEGQEGSTHFLEHLLFKGTTRRSALDISQLSDYLGGEINAATSRRYTCYYGRVFASDMPQLLELLVDLVTSATLDKPQMEMERGVILEELAAANDDANTRASEAILPAVLGDHPLARPVGGTIAEVRTLDHAHLLRHYQQNYCANELVVTAAGNVDHAELCRELQRLLQIYGWDLAETACPAARRSTYDISYTAGSTQVLAHPGLQSAVVIGVPGVRQDSPEEPVLDLLSIILGGGNSSLLFQEVREKRGLAYSAFSWAMQWQEGGIVCMQAGCAPENYAQVAQVMEDCLKELAEKEVSADTLEMAYRQYRAQLVFAMENNSFRKNQLGYAELLYGNNYSIAAQLQKIRAVTPADIQNLAAQLATAPHSTIICTDTEK